MMSMSVAKGRRSSPNKAGKASKPSELSRSFKTDARRRTSGRNKAHKLGLGPSQIRRTPSDDNSDEAAEVRALLRKAASAQAVRKSRYLQRCVEDSLNQMVPRKDYFTTVQRGKITPEVRGNIVQWLQRCGGTFELLPETVETSTLLLDRLLSIAHMPSEKHVRLVAATCLLIASKVCETSGEGVCVRDVVRACGAAFSANDVYRMERVMLNKFGWSVAKLVTPKTMVESLLSVASSAQSVDAQNEALGVAIRLLGEALSAEWYLSFSVAHVACGTALVALERYHPVSAMKVVMGELCNLTRTDPAVVDECARLIRNADVMDIPMM